MHFFQHFYTGDQLKGEEADNTLEKQDLGKAGWEESEQQREPKNNQAFIVDMCKIL